MLYQIKDGTVSAGGKVILSHIDFEIRGTEKIAVVGKNGAGKTTLLNVIAGTIPLDRDDKRMGPGILCSRKVMTGMLSQQVFADEHRTVEELLMLSCPLRDSFDRERFEYEQEYDRLFTGLGFAKEDKKKPISRFSGGEQTKIALIRLLLEKPDILLLDEPTNHLDMETCEWLEGYMGQYKKAVVMVSHDRFFLVPRMWFMNCRKAGLPDIRVITRITGKKSLRRYSFRKRLMSGSRRNWSVWAAWWSALSISQIRHPLPVQNARPWSGWNGWKGPRRMTAASLQER